MSEAERITDWGEVAFEEYSREESYRIYDEKLSRLRRLKGKYVIVSKSKSGRTIYLQDRSLSKERWWTYYLDCAMGFVSWSKALDKAQSYRFGKYKVIEVTEMMVGDAEESLYNLMYAGI